MDKFGKYETSIEILEIGDVYSQLISHGPIKFILWVIPLWHIFSHIIDDIKLFKYDNSGYCQSDGIFFDIENIIIPIILGIYLWFIYRSTCKKLILGERELSNSIKEFEKLFNDPIIFEQSSINNQYKYINNSKNKYIKNRNHCICKIIIITITAIISYFIYFWYENLKNLDKNPLNIVSRIKFFEYFGFIASLIGFHYFSTMQELQTSFYHKIVNLQQIIKHQSSDLTISLIENYLRTKFHSYKNQVQAVLYSYDVLNESLIYIKHGIISYEDKRNITELSEKLSTNLKHLSENASSHISVISDVSQGKFEIKYTNFNILESVKGIVSNFTAQANSKNIKFQDITHTLGNNFLVNLDEDILKLVLDNFITNAIKWAKTSINIEIYKDLYNDKNSIYIKVFDDGPGIPNSKKSLVFLSQQKIHENDKNKGSGYGLNTVKNAVKQVNGEVYIENPKNNIGSVFCVILSEQENVTPSPSIDIGDILEKSKLGSPLIKDSENEIKNPKILIVDDEEINILCLFYLITHQRPDPPLDFNKNLYIKITSPFCRDRDKKDDNDNIVKYDFYLVKSAETAVKLLKKHFIAVFTDLRMEKGDCHNSEEAGFWLIKKIREIYSIEETKIGLITGDSIDTIVKYANSLDSIPIMKPIQSEENRNKILQILIEATDVYYKHQTSTLFTTNNKNGGCSLSCPNLFDLSKMRIESSGS